jgi:hypothetical protein
LLVYHSINHVEYLIAEARLTQSSHASSQGQRPQHRQGNKTNRADSRFVNPALLADHRHYTASSTLQV